MFLILSFYVKNNKAKLSLIFELITGYSKEDLKAKFSK